LKSSSKFLFFLGCIILQLLLPTQTTAQFYNGTKIDFGKNRVQYDDFKWQFYRFPKYETYFYTGGKEMSVHAAKYLNLRIPELESFFDYQMSDRIQFVIYNKQSHYRQSNVGLGSERNQNLGGITKIVGNKAFVYFEGDYDSFEKQLDAGLIEVLINQIVYGGNWREVIRNSTLVDLPEWYSKGLISFMINEHDPLIQAKIKDGIINNKFKRFNTLSNEQAEIVGHGLWQYVSNTYGDEVIPNILYMTRIAREVNDGFLYVIGLSLDQLYEEWRIQAKSRYMQAEPNGSDNMGEKMLVKMKKNRRYQNLKVSPNERYISYSTNQDGQYKVYLHDLQTNKKEKIFKREHKLERIQDYSYPIVEWHPSGDFLTFISEDKGDLLFYNYTIESEELAVKPIFKMEKVLSYQFLKSGKQFVFSGVNEGQSDLYLYNMLGNTQKKLTDDIYDDLLPTIDDNSANVFFVSNRMNDSLNLDHHEGEFSHEKDIFVLDLKQNNYIQSVTNTPGLEETAPILLNGTLSYLAQHKGRTSQYTAKYDSVVSKIDTIIHYRYFYETNRITDYSSPVLSQSVTSDGVIYQSGFNKGTFQFYKKQLRGSKIGRSDSSKRIISKVDLPKESFQVFYEKATKLSFDYTTYEFNNNTAKPVESIAQNPKEKEVDFEALDFPTQRLYRLNFRTDNTMLQLNHTFINGQYEVYNGGPYTNSGIGINTKIGIVDLMEDHKVYGGFRYAGNLIEYSLSYQNLKNRLDKEYTITRTRDRISAGQTFTRGNVSISSPYDLKTLRGIASYSYPFSEITSLRGVVSLRNDKIIPLSTDQGALETEFFNEFYGSVKVAYVYDNTRELAVNILSGTRFRIFGEHYERLYSDARLGISNFQVIGADFRYYQKIHREMILVTRFAASKSFGKTPLIYYLGGTDEWISQDQFDRTTPIDDTQNYGFQALAANMRGFKQNIRNGSAFALINTELRWPIVKYFMRRPVEKPFLRDFQVVGFADIGTAWEGASPFADDNLLNSEILPIPRNNSGSVPITITYENINDPIVGGVGFGLRSTLLGYFVRVDVAWGIENGIISKDRIIMFSLTLDI
jgi:WD40 repeat protein